MKHSFLDRYSDGASLMHRLDPRTKFIAAFLLILALALTEPGRWLVYAAYFVLIAVLVLLSRVPVLYILKRSLTIIPFVLVIAVFIPFFKGGDTFAGFYIGSWRLTVSHQGLQLLGAVAAKAWLSILSLILLMATTPMSRLLRGLEQLRLPRVMVMTLSFMYRYIFILTDEVLRMKQARDSRAVGGSRLFRIKTVGSMAGTLFIRSYERGERVYTAMAARGYDGRTRTLRRLSFQSADLLFGAGLALVLAFILIYNYWHWI
ncbi:MAG: cobalt ECF transporter T component CbiQ [Dehalococcoidales bacterium]|jgi:cobalt/nickel transport system permease protein